MTTKAFDPVILDVAGAVGAIADTRRHKALLKSGALQNAIFNSQNFSSIATDEKGVIQLFNVGAERMLGYPAADVMNQLTPADIADPLEVSARAKVLSHEFATPVAAGFEALVYKATRGDEDIFDLTFIRKDASQFPAVVAATVLRDAQDAIIGYLFICTDNSARKQFEKEQVKLNQRLRDLRFYTRSLFESNLDALMATDPSGFITDVNKQMEALTGCTRDELIGAPLKDYFTDPSRAEAVIRQVLSERKVTNYELTACSRDGKKTVVSYNATTFYDRDRALQGVFASARDVTEFKRIEQELQKKNIELEAAKSAAETANQAKSDFLSSMSHELRSPLNSILGFAQLLESDSPRPTQREAIEHILQAGWHLLTLINEILDLAKIESHQVALVLEPVSLAEVLQECRAMIEPQAQQLGIAMSFPQFASPCFAHADRVRIKQVLLNMLSNALKYNRDQGQVIVDWTPVGTERVRISVQDTGEGLAAAKLAQLFQPFNRLGQETGAKEGTGIGLVVVKRLVEQMGGVVGVESTVGVGSVFWFELDTAPPPLSQAAGEEAQSIAPPVPVIQVAEVPAAEELPPNGAAHKVLYVEDNPSNLKLVEQIMVRRPDLHLLTAPNGRRGIEIARASRPEVIVMDINLPDINGVEVLKVLRTNPTTAHIPVVALSANAMPSDIEKGMQAGFFQYLTKPIKVGEFMDTVNGALEFADQSAGATAR
ncbi:MAG: PAS domain S-box protein [Sulfuricella sp.]|nr:PAS domain S-box protein [Sulfuricella sp.]